ncbi:HelD family protein [Demequina muriae]|uniref:AAA family ATPase n=1 Tax=Demequina muriae TaxID=3051664 RepID=A0ABT8GDN7_9MICO|nr:AAA family ATPase [Demequina sp. EGI L300058]MDN4479535.1 AAA family ATPase [Demequina sp. EGI L300058]
MHDDRTLAAERRGLEAEQHVVDALYARLDDVRDEAGRRLAGIRREGPSGSPQNRSERDAFATLYEDRIMQLDAVEDRLCFGRLDMSDGERFYVGRIGLSDADHAPLLTDWRAPAAQAFYAATAANPGGVINRRHLTTRGRTVVAVEDDVLDVERLHEAGLDEGLAGEGALLAALGARRTGRMGDIVATIQTEQDEVIRAPLTGALVVQGGPGTGKTAVALHRAAFLMYHHREQLERRGVLMIGPSRQFLRYIDHVLPSLGETGAVSTTLAGLVREATITGVESDEVAALKGRTEMATVVKNAVRERQRVPQADQEVRIDGRTVVIRRSDVKEAQSRARREGRPHNDARAAFAKDMISRLTNQLMEQLESHLDADDRIELERDVRDSKPIRVMLNLCWLPVSPAQLLRDLFSKPHLLDYAARSFDQAERDLLLRPASAPFTEADIPLLDEAAELLGDMPGDAPRAASSEASEEELDYARSVLDTFGGDGMVSAESLAARMKGSETRMSVAERAMRDRTWTYGHVVVDEAQELSPMAWRMLLRRCPTRSFTIVGDVAQVASAAGTRWWPETMDPLFGDSWQMRELTISYRIPAAVAEVAQAFATAARLPVSELRAARELDDAVATTAVDGVDALMSTAARVAAQHASEMADGEGGLVAVIVPDTMAASARAAVAASAVDGADVEVHTARETKGLEFDVAVVVEPAAIAARPGDLYVALTRPTRRLEIVHAEALPAGLA